jgi:hypothetical protein
MGGSTRETTTVNLPPPSAAELALQQQQLELGQQQLAAIQQQQQFTTEMFTSFMGSQTAEQEAQSKQFAEQFEFLQSESAFNRTLLKQQADLLRQTGLRAEKSFAIDEANSEQLRQLQESQLALGQSQADRALELRPIEDQLLQLQLQNMQAAQQPSEQDQILLDILRQQSSEQQAGAAGRQEVQDLLLQNLRNVAQSPEAISQAITGQADLAIESGLEDINSLARRLGITLRTELAPARGLRPTDTPILDRGGEIQRAGIEQAGQLIRGVRSAEAAQQAQLPLQIQQLLGQLGGAQTQAGQAGAGLTSQLAGASAGLDLSRLGFGSEVASGQQQLLGANQQFQQQLADAAAQNRLALTGQFLGGVQGAGGLGLGLATGINANTAGALANFQNLRLGSSSRTTETRSSPGLGGVLGGLGGLFTGLGSGGLGLSFASDIRLKKDIVKVGEFEDGINIYEFAYKWAKQRFRGVMANEVEKIYPKAVTTINGYKAVYYDMLGLKMESV